MVPYLHAYTRYPTCERTCSVNQQDPAGRASGDAPIYAALIRERGDVPADVKRAADQLLAESGRAVNFVSVRAA